MKAGGRVKGGPQVGKVARWLHNPYRLGGSHRFRAGGGAIRGGPQVGKVAT